MLEMFIWIQYKNNLMNNSKLKEEKLEVLVFGIISKFKPLLHKDLVSNEFSDFHWEDSKTLSYFVNGKIINEEI